MALRVLVLPRYRSLTPGCTPLWLGEPLGADSALTLMPPSLSQAVLPRGRLPLHLPELGHSMNPSQALEQWPRWATRVSE